MSATTRLLLGPFNRVEGDLEVHLEISDGQVQSARVNATMYRGFEQLLQGKSPMDALVYVPRICGICSVSQSVAAAHALADAARQARGSQATGMPANGRHALNLMLATENLADHLTHFYLFFMPDFTREVYTARPWYATVQQRMAALSGEHSRQATAMRQRWFTMLGTMGGKWPHTQSVQPGGSSRALDLAERMHLLGTLAEMRQFLERTVFAAPLEALCALDSHAALLRWHAQGGGGDLRLFMDIAHDLGLITSGPGPGRFLSYGAYPQPGSDAPTWSPGLWQAANQTLQPVNLGQITEDATCAWLHDESTARHPWQGSTLPDADKVGAYTWNKAPRLDGQVIETGAIARQLVSGNALVRDLVAQHGSSVYTRVMARLLEMARILPLMEQWVAAFQSAQPWHIDTPLPDHAQAVGLVEAARGALGHWLRIEDGKLVNYQIVAPTSWNFSPRDAQGTPGALEQALAGLSVTPGDDNPVAVQHIVRSFDPCMVCTVH
jgi:uptake hydrogenase large subunit